MTTHAILSPSSAHRWSRCTAAPFMERGLPDSSSEASEEGTAAHWLAAMCLNEGRPPTAYVGRRAPVGEHKTLEVTADMARDVTPYVEAIMAKSMNAEITVIEVPVPLDHITGEAGATGTADAILIIGDELNVDDLKFGANPRNAVEAEDNDQLIMYTLGALAALTDPLGMEIKSVRMTIHQPRLGRVSEWVQTIEEMEAHDARLSEASVKARVSLTRAEPPRPELFAPGEKTCQWCKAKATCPALRDFTEKALGADLSDLADEMTLPAADDSAEQLAFAMSAAPLVEQWIKAVRAEAERRLVAGLPVPGWKLVQGRAGSRAWTDPEAAEAMLKTFRLKVEEMYDLKLISPTTAEKLVKEKVIGPRQWDKAQALIGRSEGSPTVVPEKDPRPPLAVAPSADDVADLA